MNSPSVAGTLGHVLSPQTTRRPQIALCGNPNSGKSTIFNLLTGLSQKVANYPGVTVERHSGTARFGTEELLAELIDIPGSYSLSAQSPDEAIAVDSLLGEQGERSPDLVICVLDATALERGLYLLLQVIQMPVPIVVVINMADTARQRGIGIDSAELSHRVGKLPVVVMTASKGEGIDELRRTVVSALKSPPAIRKDCWPYSHHVDKCINRLKAVPSMDSRSNAALIRLLFDEERSPEIATAAETIVRHARQELREAHGALLYAETGPLTKAAADIAEAVTTRRSSGEGTPSQQIDRWVLHPIIGPLLLLLVMTIIFQSIFSWAEPLMSLIDTAFSSIAALVASAIPAGALQSLIADGIIGGVGSVIMFLPQIMLLFLFIAILEDTGYLPRAALIVDRLFGWCGLSGKSFIPMLSSFACAIPGIMACRTIEDRRVRLLTIMVSPLMSCSARLPVYTIMIAAFIPATPLLGLFNLQGVVLLTMYLLGVAVAVVIAVVVHRLLLKSKPTHFLMELPPYRLPTIHALAARVWLKSSSFIKEAGTIILAITMVIWALSYYPRSELIVAEHEAQRQALVQLQLPPETEELELAKIDQLESGALLRDSYFGRMGRSIEPVFRPLGWDWKITMAALASFPAREVVVATLGAIYNLGSDVDESSTSLIDKMRQATWEEGPLAGTAVFTPAVALSIMIFFALCCQCGATLATIRQETGHWWYSVAAFVYMTTLAYAGSFVAFQAFRSIGW